MGPGEARRNSTVNSTAIETLGVYGRGVAPTTGVGRIWRGDQLGRRHDQGRGAHLIDTGGVQVGPACSAPITPERRRAHRTPVGFAAVGMNGTRYCPAFRRSRAQPARATRVRAGRQPMAKGDRSMGARDTTARNLRTAGVRRSVTDWRSTSCGSDGSSSRITRRTTSAR
jgi:hypothetical protein